VEILLVDSRENREEVTGTHEGETLIFLPETAHGFRSTNGSLHSLGEAKGLSFHNFRLLEDRCLCLLMKNVGKRMPEAEIKKVEPLHLNVQAVRQLSSKCRDQDPEKDRPLTPHFVVSVARGHDVAKVRSLTELRPADSGGDVCVHKRAASMQTLPALLAPAA
jgi:hypothetical protein